MHWWSLHGRYLVSVAPLVLPSKTFCASRGFASCDCLNLERKEQYSQFKLGYSNVAICQLSHYE